MLPRLMVLLTLFSLPVVGWGQTVIYNADFSNDGDGFPDHTSSSPPAPGPATAGPFGASGNQWSLSYDNTPSTDSSPNSFSVSSSSLVSDDWGGQGIFQSQSIDITSVNTISISASSTNSGATDNSFVYFYILDGGARVETANISSANGDPVNYSITNLDVSGNSSIIVGFEFSENGFGDGYTTTSFTITVPATPDLTIADNNQPVNGNVDQGAQDHILSAVSVAVTTANATLNTFEIDIDGTFDSDDVDNFQLFYSSTNSFGSASQIGSNVAGSGNGTSQTVTFSGLSQAIDNGSTGYFWVVADVSTTATATNTLTAQQPTVTFTSGNITNNSSAAGTQTIATPTVTLSSPIQVVAGTLIENTTNHQIYRFDLAVASGNAVLQDANITTNGTYVAGQVSNLKLWYSADATFDAGSDVVLSTITSPGAAGAKSFTTITPQLITSTGYFFVTVDVPCGVTAATTIGVDAVTTSDLTFSATVNKSGTATAGGTQTMAKAAPNNVTALSVSAGNAQASVSWTNPTGCFDEVIIVAHTTSISGTPSGNYTANSQSYTDGNNDLFPGGGVVVYNGSTSPQTITDLTNGTTYYFKVFTRNGAQWSSGVEVSGTPANTTIINFDDDLKWTAGSGGITGYQSDHSYVDGLFSATGGPALRNTTAVTDGFPGALGIYSWRLRDNSAVEWQATISSGGVNDFSMSIRRWDGSPSPDFSIDYSLDGGSNWTNVATINNTTLSNSSDWSTFSGTINSWRDNIIIRVKANGTTERIMIDDFEWSPFTPDYTYNGAWSPSNPSGQNLSSSNITISSGTTSISGALTQVKGLWVEEGAALTVGSSSTLEVADLDVDGTLTISDGGALLTDEAAIITGNVTVQRTGTPYSNVFNYWSTPVSGAAYNSVWSFGNGSTDYNSGDFYYFDPSQITGGDQMTGWKLITEGSNMTPGQGFIGTGRIDGGTNTLNFTGTPNNSTINRAITTSNLGYNLIGNPYPSAIDADQFITDNGAITGTLWFWDVDITKDPFVTADYATYNNTGGTANPFGPIPTGNIASCQGFFVEATASSNVTFNNAQRIAGNNTQFFKSGSVERVWLMVTDVQQREGDQLLIGFSDQATDNYDQGWDGKKLKGNPAIAFYSKLNGDDYAIQALAPLNGQTKAVPLGLDAGKAGNYTIAIDSIDGIDPGVGIYLHDVTTNTYHDLRNSSYILTVNQDNSTLTQYELVFNATPTGIDDLGEESWFTAFTAGQTVIVRSNGALAINQLRLIDLQGRVVYSGATNGPEARIATTGLASGIYLLEALSDKGLQTKKVFIP